jgi:hypothetical protein
MVRGNRRCSNLLSYIGEIRQVAGFGKRRSWEGGKCGVIFLILLLLILYQLKLTTRGVFFSY